MIGIILRIIDAGRMAPSDNKQPWKFYVLTDKALIKSFAREIATAAIKGFAKSGIKNIIKSATNLLHFSHGFDYHSWKIPFFMVHLL